jgi:hypothetical protein
LKGARYRRKGEGKQRRRGEGLQLINKSTPFDMPFMANH